MHPTPFRHVRDNFIVSASPCSIVIGGVTTDGISYTFQNDEAVPTVVTRDAFEEYFVPASTVVGLDFYPLLHEVLDKTIAFEYARKLEALVAISQKWSKVFPTSGDTLARVRVDDQATYKLVVLTWVADKRKFQIATFTTYQGARLLYQTVTSRELLAEDNWEFLSLSSIPGYEDQ